MNREVMQQILDALENSTPQPLDGEDSYAECAWVLHCKAKRALEAELAKSVQPLDVPRINDLWGQALKYANPTAGDAHIKFARLIEMELRGENT